MYDINPELLREKRLWQAIINQMLIDAGSNCSKEDDQIARSQARAWLLYDERDFPVVCEHAGYEPAEVRAIARHAMRRGYVFRKPPSSGRRTKMRPGQQMELRIRIPYIGVCITRPARPRLKRMEVYEQLSFHI